MDERNKTLKEKLISRLQFEPGRAEVLLLAKGRYIVCEPADSSEKDKSELVRMCIFFTLDCANILTAVHTLLAIVPLYSKSDLELTLTLTES